MQKIVTLGEINDALKFTTVTAAQLAEMGFAALANKPICDALPQEEARRLRTAKLYPAESIGQIRVELAKRLAAPASCLHQIQEPAPVLAAQPEGDYLEGVNIPNLREALIFLGRENGVGEGEVGDKLAQYVNSVVSGVLSKKATLREAPQAAPAAVAVPDERVAFEAWAREYGTWDVERDDVQSIGIASYTDVAVVVAWHAWQARAALAATPAAGELATLQAGLQAAAPVVLPEPDAAIKEVMGLVEKLAFSSVEYGHKRAFVDPECEASRKETGTAHRAIESKLRALLATGGQAQAVYLPLLIRDIARDLGITTVEACTALKPLGHFSVNSAVTAEMASKLREHFPEPAAPQAQADARDALTPAARDVLAERARQISAEGWTPERDDAYNRGVLAEAGGIYALHAYDPRRAKEVPEGWPWGDAWWKPSESPRRNLEKAGALILAEIERFDRAIAAAKGE